MEVLLRGVSAGPQPGKVALHDCSLQIAAGEQVAIIGPSGAGKTTLLQVLGLALAPIAGQVLHGGVDPWGLSTRQRRGRRAQVFLAPQVPPLPPRQRVVTGVLAGRLSAFGAWRSLRTWIYPEPRDLADAAAALAQFDLADKLFERVDRLSGGERQRVGLARALVSPASLWLVDEPLSSLDPVRAGQAVAALTAAARARSATLVVSFHQVEVAMAHFPRVLGVRNGRIVFDGPPSALHPAELARLYAVEGLPAAPVAEAGQEDARLLATAGPRNCRS